MKKYFALLLTVVMIVALCSVGTTASAANDDYHITLKLSHVFAPTEQLTVEMEKVAERILERTNGAVEIQTYGSSQLAVYKDNLQQVVDGANWIACEDPSYLADYNIDFEALIAPMLYANLQQYSYVCQSDVVKALCRTSRITTASMFLLLTLTSVVAACRPTRSLLRPMI